MIVHGTSYTALMGYSNVLLENVICKLRNTIDWLPFINKRNISHKQTTYNITPKISILLYPSHTHSKGIKTFPFTYM